MFNVNEMNEILEKLEGLEDEALAVSLLKELNDLRTAHAKLLMNTDSNLSHEEWKKESDLVANKINALVEKIKNL